MLAASTHQPGGVSPFTDAQMHDGTSYTVSTAGPTNGSAFTSGVSPFRLFCLSIADPGTYTLQFLIADQGDATFDSALLLDDVQVPSGCGAVRQVTDTFGSLLEIKGGGSTLTPSTNSDVATDQSGSVLAFVSNANLTGDNPNAVDQIFVAANGRFERVTAMPGGSPNSHVGAPAVTSNGRYVTFESAGDLTPSSPGNTDGNIEVFRWDRSAAVMVQITDTTGCENRHPTISRDNQGRRIAFATNCADLTPAFNADGNFEVVIWDAGTGNFQFNETVGCESGLPAMARHDMGRYVSFRSSCDYSGGNADGNFEIFQWDRQSNNYLQVTSSTSVQNELPSSSLDGRYVAFISSADFTGGNADGSVEVFRFDRNGGGSFQQLTDESPFVIHTYADIEDTGRFIAVEQLDVLLGTVSVLLADADTATLTPVVTASLLSALKPKMSLPAAGPVVTFLSTENLSGNNLDSNTEIFRTGERFKVPLLFSPCSSPGTMIPDNDPVGLSDTITVAMVGTILDLKVSIETTHGFVGDLSATLTHVSTGTSVTLIDRPGSPPGSGCPHAGLNVILDDRALEEVDTQCVTGPVAIDGTFKPNGLLADFLGEDISGDWTLTLSDNAVNDTGTLTQWCLTAVAQQ